MTELEKHQKGIITAAEYDSYIEMMRLNFYRNNQDTLRSDIRNDTRMTEEQRQLKEATIEALDKKVRTKYQFSRELNV